jgi:hypothetical protein
VVFDAAASFQEKCLTMLSDPALKPSLQSLLIQFREGEIAFASNVEPCLVVLAQPIGRGLFLLSIAGFFF